MKTAVALPHSVRGPWTAHGIGVVAFDDSCWRVSDQRRPACDADSCLGVVEQRDGAYQGMRTWGDRASAAFDSLEDAVRYVAARRRRGRRGARSDA